MSTHADLIRRVDRVEHQSFIQLYGAAAAWGTGWHVEDGVTSVWSAQDDDPSFSCVLDLARSPHPKVTLSRLESVAGAAGAQVIGIDIHPDLKAWAATEQLQQLGYEPDCEEIIWTLDLSDWQPTAATHAGVQVERAGEADRGEFARVLNIGWDLPEDAARGEVFAAGIGLESWRHYLAYVDGRLAGIAVLFIHDAMADCFLSATLSGFRGRGVQTALIQRRLEDGREAGCDLATSQTVVHNASPRNMARQGFQQLYRRWIFGKRLRRA